MALSDLFREDETCPTCNKNMNDVVNGKEVCVPCVDDGERLISQYTVLQHLLSALVCLFHFRFGSMIAEVSWALERLFKIGDYNPIKGKFYKCGYLDN
jgi:hypothetical protein